MWLLLISQLQAGELDVVSNWMKPLKGPISELVIPGTHDSGAIHGSVYARCQSQTISQQLSSGVRFLDVRCRHLKDDFHIYHGSSDQKQRFADVLKTCSAFLKKHPSECIVMSIKEESSAHGNTRKFGETYQTLIKPYKNLWYEENKVPLLKAVRGKIVVVSRNREVKGVSWKSLNVQDQYKVSGAAEIRKKWKFFEKHIMTSHTKPKANVWSVNFATGNGVFSPPSTVAKAMNPKIEAYAEAQIKGGGKATIKGIVVLDFPSEKLLKSLIDLNQAKGK